METLNSQINIERLILLITIAASVSIGSKYFKVPYTIALVLVGLLLSILHILPAIYLTEDLVLQIFLPALLFEAAWNLNLTSLRKYWTSVGLLSSVGLMLSVGVIGILLNWTLGLPLLVSLLFGAMISATDPVSVLAFFKQIKVDRHLSTLIESESLFNDGTAVVLFKILLSLILVSTIKTGLSLGTLVFGGFIQFMLVVCGGIGIGALFAILFSFIISRFEDHLLELTLTTVVAYGSFLIADNIPLPGMAPGIHLSSVLATVTAGLMMGVFARKRGMTATTLTVVNSFWEFAAFLVNSLIFLLIGLQIHIGFLLLHWYPILIGILAVLGGRAIAVYSLISLSNIKSSSPIIISWQHILVWGGLHGALSMALALSLPHNFPNRDLLMAMVFGVVLFSLLGQGLSIPWLAQKLNLMSEMKDHQS